MNSFELQQMRRYAYGMLIPFRPYFFIFEKGNEKKARDRYAKAVRDWKSNMPQDF